jgi:hypothetical protein
MILLHQKHDKKSREFKGKHKDKFDEVLEYPECLQRYPNISKFPAVVWSEPEYELEASLYNLITEIPNYEYLAVRVGYLIEKHNRYLRVGFEGGGFCANSGGNVEGNPDKLWFEDYAERKGLENDYILYFIEAVNFGDIPAFILAWTFRDYYKHDIVYQEWDGNIGITNKKYKDPPNEESKTRSVNSLDETVGLVKTVPAKDYIFYPDEFEDIDKQVKKLRKHKKIRGY